MTSIRHYCLALLFTVIAVTSSSAQTILRVDASASDGGDGTSWSTAFNDLEDALEVAKEIAGPDSPAAIWIAAGTYTPETIFPGMPRWSTFELAEFVDLFGGFPLGGGTFEERDPVTHATILSGDLAGDDGPNFTNNDENAFHVLIGRDIDNPVILDGLTITGGNAKTSNGQGESNGGGMHLRDVNIMVNNCTIAGNASHSSGGGVYSSNQYGTMKLHKTILKGNFSNSSGAAFLSPGTTLELCHIIDNVAVTHGGAITGGGLSVSGCTFERNIAEHGGGGALFISRDLTVKNSTFLQNSAKTGGGISFFAQGKSTVRDSTFIENTAGIGGGMHSRYGEPTVTDCTFTRNVASIGGGIYCQDNEPAVKRCVFIGNRAQHGGGMLLDRLRFFTENRLPRTLVTHCMFLGNVAEAGGGMEMRNGFIGVTNCTFIGNAAIGTNELTAGGGGIHNALDSKPMVDNCTFFANIANTLGGGIGNGFLSYVRARNCIFWNNVADADGDAGGPFQDELAQMQDPIDILLLNSCFQDADPDDAILPFGGAANDIIDDDPQFVALPDPGPDGVFGTDDDDLGDLRLQPGSPCINRGDNALLPPDMLDLDGDGDLDEPIPFDLDGNPRILDGVVDMGAFEHATTASLLGHLLSTVVALDLHPGITNSLTAKLLIALGHVENDNDAAAISALEAFVNQVRAQADKKIPVDDAHDLIQAAEALIELLREG